MGSNFLGDVGGVAPMRRSAIISGNELVAREGVELHKSMNFRDTGALSSVFLVLKREDLFKDEWDEDSEIYVFEGHDSTTKEEGKSVDQIAMYPDGRLSDNGKFLKAATNFKDRVRGPERARFGTSLNRTRGAIDPSFAGRPLRAGSEPLQVQVYEKLDAGVWYDKGLFNLVDAKHVKDGSRKVYKFYLNPSGTREGSQADGDFEERMISASEKEVAWQEGRGACSVCGSEAELRFARAGKTIELRCALHSGAKKRGLLD